MLASSSQPTMNQVAARHQRRSTLAFPPPLTPGPRPLPIPRHRMASSPSRRLHSIIHQRLHLVRQRISPVSSRPSHPPFLSRLVLRLLPFLRLRQRLSLAPPHFQLPRRQRLRLSLSRRHQQVRPQLKRPSLRRAQRSQHHLLSQKQQNRLTQA